MDILQQQYNNNQQNNKNKTNAQKMVLNLIKISVILLIIAIVALMYFNTKPKNYKLSLTINGEAVEIKESLLQEDSQGNKYFSLKKLSELVGYNYFNGEYLKYAEDKDKCYLQNENEVVGFEANSKTIYKTSLDSETDYQYYELSKEIINKNESLYINMDDIKSVLGVYVEYSTETNSIKMDTLDKLAAKYESEIETKMNGSTMDTTYPNIILVLKGMRVISENSKFGVINTKLETVVGAKYNSLKYEEYPNIFIASDTDNKYGIIDIEGNKKINFEYDSIEIINYNPLLYKVKKNSLFGVVNEKGEKIIEPSFREIGYIGNKNDETENTLLIEGLENETTGIVVKSETGYGIINLKNGQEILPCDLNKIYSKTDLDTGIKTYYVEKENNIDTLNNYLKQLNAINVQI